MLGALAVLAFRSSSDRPRHAHLALSPSETGYTRSSPHPMQRFPRKDRANDGRELNENTENAPRPNTTAYLDRGPWNQRCASRNQSRLTNYWG
ncbi:hypothetical protein BDN71DRAFT_236845 [Pleurotus eryngii]|uniref:Uncharacterized protein n=1 Tax=Pleurotus eryngii TaxID=5323 RepID=A0A9P6DAT3_PLEER|nr:hypothetical protein BDN71DRAFT_236845 [Pleurotus eryngii]